MDSRDAVVSMTNNLPPAFSAAFGLYIDEIFTYGGFYSFIFTYIVLVGAIMASSISLSVFSREKRSKCLDFLLTKPVSRARIFSAKLLACLSLLAAMNILYIAAASIAYSASGEDPALMGTLVWASCALFFTQLVFMALGTIYAVFVRKVRSVSGIATGLGFAGFILSALHGILQEEAIRFIAPLKYFEPRAVFSEGGFELQYAVTAIAVIIACIVLSYMRLGKNDVPAV
jgi:ABC-2 type transport system permease protein